MSIHNQNKTPISNSINGLVVFLLVFAIAGFGSIPSMLNAYEQENVTYVK